jgi:hypothetical protein
MAARKSAGPGQIVHQVIGREPELWTDEVAADARKLIQPLEISHVTSPVRTRRDQSQFSKSDLPLGNTRVQAREAAAPPRSVTQ